MQKENISDFTRGSGKKSPSEFLHPEHITEKREKTKSNNKKSWDSLIG